MKKQKNKLAGLQRRKAIAGYIFISPFIVGFLVFMVKPFFQSLYMSFCTVEVGAGNFEPIWKGLDNYIRAFRIDPEFTRLLTEEVSRMVIDSLAIMVFSFFVALILNQKFKGRALVRAIFFLPVILSSGVILGLETDNSLMAQVQVAIEENTTGMSITAAVENILRTAGVGVRAFETVFEIIDNIYNIAISSGIQIIIFLSGLQTISTSMYEAADIEGCTKWESLWKITFPMISSMFSSCSPSSTIPLSALRDVCAGACTWIIFGSAGAFFCSCICCCICCICCIICCIICICICII